MLDMRHVLIVKLLHPSIWQRTSVFVFVCAGIVRWGIVLLLAHGRVAKCQTWWPVLKNATTLLNNFGEGQGCWLITWPNPCVRGSRAIRPPSQTKNATTQYPHWRDYPLVTINRKKSPVTFIGTIDIMHQIGSLMHHPDLDCIRYLHPCP